MLRKLLPIRHGKRVLAALVVMLVAIAGLYALTSSHAATVSATAEAEDGAVASGAAVKTDNDASNGSYVQFQPAVPLPGNILNLSNWYLTLPLGDPTTVKQPDLNTYQSEYFQPNTAHDAVVFMAPVEGSTTSNSEHTRSELRETAADGTLPWGWPAGSGKHVMTATESVTHLPSKDGVVSFAQIHGPDAEWYLIFLATGNSDGTATLSVKDATGKVDKQVIDNKYVLGTKFDFTVSVVNGAITVSYNGVPKITTTSTMADAYFKIGCYNQSSGDYGQVEVYRLTVEHS